MVVAAASSHHGASHLCCLVTLSLPIAEQTHHCGQNMPLPTLEHDNVLEGPGNPSVTCFRWVGDAVAGTESPVYWAALSRSLSARAVGSLLVLTVALRTRGFAEEIGTIGLLEQAVLFQIVTDRSILDGTTQCSITSPGSRHG